MAEVSVQIPVHNAERYVGQALAALRADPDPNLEILVLDDASEDGSFAALEQAAKLDRRVRVLRSSVNLGEAGARARMLTETDAEFVIVADADDILLPFPRAAYIDLARQNPSLVGVYGKMRHVDADLRDLNVIQGGAFSRFYLPYANYVSQGGLLLRRQAALDAGNYIETGQGNRSLGVDRFLWYRLSLTGDFLFVNEFRYLYRQHAAQSTHGKQERLDHCLQFMENAVIERNRDIYDALLKGGGNFPPDRLRTVMFLLGAISKRLDIRTKGYLSVLKTAERLDPCDHGPLLREHSFYLAIGQPDTALAVCDAMAERFAGDVYREMLARELRAATLRKLGKTREAETVERETLPFRAEFSRFDWDALPPNLIPRGRS